MKTYRSIRLYLHLSIFFVGCVLANSAYAYRSGHRSVRGGGSIARELASSGSSAQMISSLFNNMCLAFKDGLFVQAKCDSTNFIESFIFSRSGRGYFISPAQTPAHCLQDNGTMQIISADCTGAPNQLWLESTAEKGINLVNSGSQRCMNVAGNSKKVDGAIISYACDGEDNEQFMVNNVIASVTLPSVPPPTPEANPTPTPTTMGPKLITSLLSSLCVEFKNGALVQETCSNTSPQQEFVLAATGSTSFTISAASDAVTNCLQDNDNAIISSVACTSADNQRWSESIAVKGVNLFNLATHKCFNVAGGSTSRNAAIIAYECDGSWNSQFSLTKAIAPTRPPLIQ